jgi:hypothetical protein
MVLVLTVVVGAVTLAGQGWRIPWSPTSRDSDESTT